MSHALSKDGTIGSIIVSDYLPSGRPVRAIAFDKTPSSNWALGWHQDRTIWVEKRNEIFGFGPWTQKQGLLHVEPPFEIIERMLTVRIHLDDVGIDNAPLLIAPGSHKRGLIAENAVQKTIDECGTFVCEANAGDVWIYSTPIIHASQKSSDHARRRVLQVDYSNVELPSGLRWGAEACEWPK
ncbi:phytanoyl-CoA dioxygenase family protein [Qipengyuania psychrotolerans]|uniref:Phytanoyl-CoA dioxygenase family protein n=1 Tax=Qipengyuania psychrotolerans TaxID=2867238 RepID=A0ABX8ZFG8_9SPHN|nr:phytanoyl-CoA dioxygenase family protein [Qipengyuania psychrotolerans]QZD86257.1 phytanoyl-CoA dioxygenase family protein [Qipengyuania psychrotolerans]